MISNWNSRDLCSQTPGNFSLATMPVSNLPPKLVGGLHIPKHNVNYLNNIYLDIFWRHISIPVQWTPGFRLGEFEANLVWLRPGVQDLGYQAETVNHILQDLLFFFFNVFLPILIILYRRIPFPTSSKISSSRRIPCTKILTSQFMLVGMAASQFPWFPWWSAARKPSS